MLLLVLVVVFLVVAADGGTGGGVRAEVGGGARGAARRIGARQARNLRAARARRRRRLSKTWHGRARLAIEDEVLGVIAEGARGWREGARAAHERRRTRRQERRTGGAQDDAQQGAQDDAQTAHGWPYDDPDDAHSPDAQPTNAQVTPTNAGDAQPPEPDAQPGAQAGPAPAAAAPNTPSPAAAPGRKETPLMADTVADITTAPALIRAWAELRDDVARLDEQAAALADRASRLGEPSEFSVGGEEDAASAVRAIADKSSAAAEDVSGVHDALVSEFGAVIEAADGTTADVLATVRDE